MKTIEFIESYRVPEDGGDYIWNDNHGRLIRCKDCKHWVTVIKNAEYGICNKRTNLDTTSRMFFCGNGEGKE